MKGWQILVHAVRVVLRNRDAALRVSAVLYGAIAIFEILAFLNGAGPESAGPSGISALVSVLAGLWIAVSWHRYVLREELPDGWLPQWRGGLMLGYLGRGLLVSLLAMIPAAVAGGVIMGLGSAVNSVAFTGLGVVATLMIAAVVFYRLCSVMPAGAVGSPINLGQAWAATSGEAGTILTMVAGQILGVLALQIPVFVLAVVSPALALLVGLALNWVIMLVSASILTTFYGVFIEERALG